MSRMPSLQSIHQTLWLDAYLTQAVPQKQRAASVPASIIVFQVLSDTSLLLSAAAAPADDSVHAHIRLSREGAGLQAAGGAVQAQEVTGCSAAVSRSRQPAGMPCMHGS